MDQERAVRLNRGRCDRQAVEHRHGEHLRGEGVTWRYRSGWNDFNTILDVQAPLDRRRWAIVAEGEERPSLSKPNLDNEGTNKFARDSHPTSLAFARLRRTRSGLPAAELRRKRRTRPVSLPLGKGEAGGSASVWGRAVVVLDQVLHLPDIAIFPVGTEQVSVGAAALNEGVPGGSSFRRFGQRASINFASRNPAVRRPARAYPGYHHRTD